MDVRWSALITSLIIVTFVPSLDAQSCKVPKHFHGDWYSIERGDNLNTVINENGLLNKYLNSRCYEYHPYNDTIDAQGRFDARFLFKDSVSKCFQCFDLFYRTPNVLQYKISSCRTQGGNGRAPTFDEVCSEIVELTDMLTMFKTTMDVVNCKQTFEGVYHFTYEVNYGGGGICNSPQSQIVACQEPGSPYVDNQVFNMHFGRCPDVSSSSNDRIRFQCMGSWMDDEGSIFSAVADLGHDIPRERFKCMRTTGSQQFSDNTRRYTMSRWAECSSLKTEYIGDIRLVLLPVVYETVLVQPSCNLPRNFTGTWFTTGEFDTAVTINATHIYFKTKIDEFTYKETYFTCQQNRDTRFLMTAITVGKCEVDYVCWDFMPRHHNIVRWRMGKPFRLTQGEMAAPDFLTMKFRQACTWSSFTFDRNKAAWKYNTFILDPPAPVDCPIGGRYHFIQTGESEEKYHTRIRGMTERPRHMIDCRKQVTEFKSCGENPKKIYIDAEYCDTVDHTGRPIGEYDEPDRELSCVGFWMEDMMSYLITYDEEDAVSPFRCWVYERLDWRDLIISRATRGTCGVNQTASSWSAKSGASLHLELKEAERQFDNCPQRFYSGVDPYERENKIYVVGGATANQLAFSLTSLCVVLTLLMSH